MIQEKYKDELLDMIQVRLDTIKDDPSSADEFETIDSLQSLEIKIRSDVTQFTIDEKKWLVEEIENRMNDVPNELHMILGIEKDVKRIVKIPDSWFPKPKSTSTDYEQSFQYNDGGRAAAGYKGHTGDCVARAICIASGLPYQQVYDTLANGNATQKKTKRGSKRTGQRTASHGINVKRKWFQDYMKSIGFKWVPTMLIGQGCKVHLRADELPKGRLVITVSKHYTAMIDGVLMDTYDCSRQGQRCVYGYFIKE